jgi:hypothetical protein
MRRCAPASAVLRFGCERGADTHVARIAFPSAVVRALVPTHRHEQADHPIDQTAPDTACRGAAARTSHLMWGRPRTPRHGRSPRYRQGAASAVAQHLEHKLDPRPWALGSGSGQGQVRASTGPCWEVGALRLATTWPRCRRIAGAWPRRPDGAGAVSLPAWAITRWPDMQRPRPTRSAPCQ